MLVSLDILQIFVQDHTDAFHFVIMTSSINPRLSMNTYGYRRSNFFSTRSFVITISTDALDSVVTIS